METNNTCRQHSGFLADIIEIKKNISDLWLKWNDLADVSTRVKTNKERLKEMEGKLNGMQKIAWSIMVTLCFNLAGVVIAVILLYLKTK